MRLGPMRGCTKMTLEGAVVPTLFRFLVIVAILAGLGFAAMYALATLVQPEPREITVTIPNSKLSPAP